jgi:hypothetical protein
MQRFAFSSRDLPDRQAVEATRATYASLARLELEPLDKRFAADVSTLILPGLVLAEVNTSPVEVRRTPALLTDGNDDLNLHICTGGGGLTIRQRGRDEMHLRAGDVWFAPNDCPQRAVHNKASRGLSITIPRASLKPRLITVDLGRIRKLPPAAELHLFAHYAVALIAIIRPVSHHEILAAFRSTEGLLDPAQSAQWNAIVASTLPAGMKPPGPGLQLGEARSPLADGSRSENCPGPEAGAKAVARARCAFSRT